MSANISEVLIPVLKENGAKTPSCPLSAPQPVLLHARKKAVHVFYVSLKARVETWALPACLSETPVQLGNAELVGNDDLQDMALQRDILNSLGYCPNHPD